MFLSTAVFHLVYLVLGTPKNICTAPTEKYVSGNNTNVDEAIQFLWSNDKLTAEIAHKVGIATWNYQTNLTEENKEIMMNAIQEEAEFMKRAWKNATSFAWKQFKGKKENIYRWFKELSILGEAALPEGKLKELTMLTADMQDIYSTAKICRFNATHKPCDLSLEPELTELLKKSQNYDELKHVWVKFRDATGQKMRKKFLRSVELGNEAAHLNGFKDKGELWREAYESKTFMKDVKTLLRTVEPLYKHLHAYVRRKLIQRYPGRGIKPDGPIPAHLLGNMWAQTWDNIFGLVKPYPMKKYVDVTDTMIEKGMTPLIMFKTAEEFFTSLGLKPMTPEFWNRSIIEKPSDRELVCHASAWDFSDGKDFRIKMCTSVNMEDFITVHHEMGHIEYYLQYADQPSVFRTGANPGFHEAVGDVLALSVATPKHLLKIGLLTEDFHDEEAEINNLMKTALNKIAFIPFGYVIDSWRWKVFSGDIRQDELNTKWWERRLKYQGLCPPVKRTEDDFDPGAKYHVAADVPYIRYFVSFIIQFQFHKSLCDAAGHKGPLHKCDIYQNKDAGQLLSNMLSLGSSVHWQEAMNIITNGKTNKMDAKPLLEYFDPLLKWLEMKNKNETLGWKSDEPTLCP